MSYLNSDRITPGIFTVEDITYINFLDAGEGAGCYTFSTWLLHRKTSEKRNIELMISSDRYAPCVDAVRHFFSRSEWLVMAEFTEVEIAIESPKELAETLAGKES